MSAQEIVNANVTLEEIRAALRESPLAAIRQQLPDKDILDACGRCKHRWRDRLYNPVVTVFHFIAQALQRELSFAATWQQLWTPVAAAYPDALAFNFDPSGLTHARGRLPQGVLEILAKDACRRAGEFAPPLWKKLRLVALDASTLSMPRQKELFDHFGTHKARSTTVGYPLATFVSLLETGSSLVLDYNFGPFDHGELFTAAPLLSNLSKGDLLLADRQFSNAPFIMRVRARDADFLMRKNARLKVENLPVIRPLGANDFITELSISKPARKNHPDLADSTVRARVFKASWKAPGGRKVSEWFVTSLTDAVRFRRNVLARLYRQRWQAETSYMEFKQTFHADVLRSKTLENVQKEFSAHLLAYQLVRLVMAHAATRAHKKATLLSTINAARWITNFSMAMSVQPATKLPAMYLALLEAISSSRIDVRPGRIEPRAISRERKHYPRMRCSRREWKNNLLRKLP